MPATAILLILIGVFILINVFNGNLIDVAQGQKTFSFLPTPPKK